MIVIAGTIEVQPEHREAAVQSALVMAEASRAEAGCVSYNFYSDLQDPNTFFIFEVWESAEALVKHFETDHMDDFQRRLSTFVEGEMKIKKFEVSSADEL